MVEGEGGRRKRWCSEPILLFFGRKFLQMGPMERFRVCGMTPDDG